MVQQNDAKAVEDATRSAFAEFAESKTKDAVKTLTTLRGIGPATASLILSVCNLERAPFFSDELFRWAFFDSGKGNGWDRRIKYTAREYTELYDKVQQLLGRLEVSAVDAEKVAYVLGTEGVLGQSAQKDMGKSTKRKADEMDHAIAGKAGSDKAEAKIGNAEFHEEFKQEKKRRRLPDKLPPNDGDVDPVAGTASDHLLEAKSTGRPKRKSRK